MAISFQLYLRHYVSLRGSAWARGLRRVIGSRSRNWLTESHCIKPSLLHRGVQLVVFAALAFLISGLTQATPKMIVHVVGEPFVLGKPCSTMTDIKEGTCNLKVDKIKRNAGQPKPFTERWTK